MATRTRHRWHAPEKGSGPAFALSLLAHVLLFIAIAFAVRWKSEPVGAVSAELWSLPPPAAVQRPAPPPPPAPVKVEPPPPPPPEPEPRKADIVEKKVPPKVEPPKRDEAKIAAAKEAAAKEAAAREAATKQAAAKEAAVKQAAAKEAAAAKQAAAKEAARIEADRNAAADAALKRLLAQAGPSANTAGAAGGGLSNTYRAQIVSCIRPHIVFNVPDAVQPKQYVAEFEVILLPTGEQAAVPRLLKASGLAAYDQAVERAIRRCDPFPPPKEGTMPRSLRLSFDPVETR